MAVEGKAAYARFKESFETVGDTSFPEDVVRGVIEYVEGLSKNQKKTAKGKKTTARKTTKRKTGPSPTAGLSASGAVASGHKAAKPPTSKPDNKEAANGGR